MAIATIAPRRFSNGIEEFCVNVAAPAVPTLLITAVALAVMKKWFTAHHERTRADLTAVTDARLRLDNESAAYLRSFAEREQHLAAAAESQRVLLSGMAERLQDAAARLEEERFARSKLQTEFDDLAEEHNHLVVSVMQERANLFSRRPAATARIMDTAEGVVPLRLRPRDGASQPEPNERPCEHPCTADLGDAR